jgi:hypothetical protein
MPGNRRFIGQAMGVAHCDRSRIIVSCGEFGCSGKWSVGATTVECPVGGFVATRQDEGLSPFCGSFHAVTFRVEPPAAQARRVRYPQHLAQDDARVLGWPALRIGAVD